MHRPLRRQRWLWTRLWINFWEKTLLLLNFKCGDKHSQKCCMWCNMQQKLLSLVWSSGQPVCMCWTMLSHHLNQMIIWSRILYTIAYKCFRTSIGFLRSINTNCFWRFMNTKQVENRNMQHSVYSRIFSPLSNRIRPGTVSTVAETKSLTLQWIIWWTMAFVKGQTWRQSEAVNSFFSSRYIVA